MYKQYSDIEKDIDIISTRSFYHPIRRDKMQRIYT